jgi:hypothetical protein
MDFFLSVFLIAKVIFLFTLTSSSAPRIVGLGKLKEELLDQSTTPSTFSPATVSLWIKLCWLSLA